MSNHRKQHKKRKINQPEFWPNSRPNGDWFQMILHLIGGMGGLVSKRIAKFCKVNAQQLPITLDTKSKTALLAILLISSFI